MKLTAEMTAWVEEHYREHYDLLLELAKIPAPSNQEELRAVNQLSQRISEVRRLGFTKCVVPAYRIGELGEFPGLQLIPAHNIAEAIRGALRQTQ